MQIGRLELSSRGEWVVYNPLAKAITNMTGRITVDGIGKINASLPNRYGEFEFHDPRAAAEFLGMPGHVSRLEQNVDGIKQEVDGIKQDNKEVLNLVKHGTYSKDKSGSIVAEKEDG